MAVTNTLTMKFRTADEKTRQVSLQPCKPSAAEADVKALMDSMISSEAFVYEPAVKLGATLTQRITATLF